MTDHPGAGRSRRRIWILAGVLVSAVIAVAATTGAIVAMSRGGGSSSGPGIAAGAAAPTGGSNAAALSPGAPINDLGPAPGAAGGNPTPVPVPVPVGAGATAVNVPVLVYHYVRVVRNACDSLGMSLSVTPTVLNQQLTLLQVAGYHVIGLDTLMAAVLNGAPLPSHPVVLTFDDGYADFATAAVPILLAHNMTATDFVVPGFLGRPSYMTTEQVLLAEDAGMSIGAHTMHHVALAHVAPARAAVEITGSRTFLQQLLGEPVADFAYPYGDFNGTVEQLVAKAGFRDGFTTISGTRQSPQFRYALPRIHVGNGLAYFAAQLGIPATAQAAAAAVAAPLPPGEDPGSPPRARRC